jgi:hypothetical protein
MRRRWRSITLPSAMFDEITGRFFGRREEETILSQRTIEKEDEK